MFFSFEISPKNALCHNWLKLAQWFWRRDFLNFVNVFSLHVFCNNLPLEMGGALHLNKLESPSHNDALWQVWLKLAKWFWRRRFFNLVNVFSLFRNYLPLEKGGALHLNKRESPTPKLASCQVWSKLAPWFWIRIMFNFVNTFSPFRDYLPFEKGGALHLNKRESPTPKLASCQVWLKLAQWFWRRRFLNFVNVFHNYRPFGNGRGPYFFYKLESPSPKDALCQVCLKLAQCFWRTRF